MSLHPTFKKYHAGLQCPFCFYHSNLKLKAFKNQRAIDIHIKRAHDISDEEYDKNRQFLKSWNKSSEGKLSKVPSKEGRIEMSSFATRVPFVNAKLTSTPSAHNPVYNYPKRSKCPAKCTRKTFTTVWQLHMHMQYHHKNEGNRNQISIALAEEVIRDMKK